MSTDNWRGRIGAMQTDNRVSELVGLCKGVLADGMLVLEEARYIAHWVVSHPELAGQWPVSELIAPLQFYLDNDGLQGERELLERLNDFVSADGGEAAPTRLPLTKPVPAMQLSGAWVCLTGTFDNYKRAELADYVKAAGALHKATVSRKLDYLVIGGRVTPAWRHSSFGDKIAKAVALNEAGSNIRIVEQATLLDALDLPD